MQKTILEQLRDCGFIVGDIAKTAKVHRSCVYQSLQGGGSRNVRILIALKLDKKPSDLWPENATNTLMIDDALFRVKSSNNVIDIKDRSLFGGA